jgi:hypothetical protein
VTYQITNFDPYTGTIQVLYEGISSYTLNLPIDAVSLKVPEGDELDKLINAAEPTFFINQAKALTEKAEPTRIANADTILALVQVPKQPDPILDAEDLQTAQNYAINMLVSQLASTQGSFFSGADYNNPLNAYLQYTQALAYKAAGYTGTIPPFLQERILQTGEGAQDVADLLIAQYDSWFTSKAPKLNGAFVKASKAIQAATTNADVNAAYKAGLAALKAIVAPATPA